MDEPIRPIDEDKLLGQLEKAAKKLEGQRRDHFTDTQSICGHCRWAHITRRQNKNNRVIFCTTLSQIMPDDIQECSEYTSLTQLSLQQMAGLAWIIDPRDHTKGGYL